MKLAVLAMIFAISVVVSARKRCSSNDDCEADECCISRGIFTFRKGECRPLAGEGEDCSDELEHVFGKYTIHCPCEIGLSCQPEKEKDLGVFGKIKINERCVSEPVSTEEPAEETEPTVDETEKPAEE